ncbi:MAG: LysM peptidoglycan-binding domain-containing protein [Proteobacteria bacterium]|nr:LysM peptidoglycan-binding domain-containing protein [Pseudomonadota bacterium]
MGSTDGGSNKKAFFQINDPASSEDQAYFYVQFNPKEFKLDESVGWSDGKSADDKATTDTAKDAFLTFDKGKPATVAMELVFDTTDSAEDDVGKKWIQPLRSLVAATVADKDGEDNDIIRPPYVVFKWGEFEFPCVVEKLGVSYLMFRPDGRPLRAKVSVALKEREDTELRLSSQQEIVLTTVGSMLSSGQDQAADDPTKAQANTGTSQHQSNGAGNLQTSRSVKANEHKPTKTYVTQEGETLTDVAAKTGADYEDIAKANNIDNPMELEPGTLLVIPSSSVMATVFEHQGKSDGPAAWSDYQAQLNPDSDLASDWDNTPGEYIFEEQEVEEMGLEYTPYTSTQELGVFEHKPSSAGAVQAAATSAAGTAHSTATEAAVEAGVPTSAEGAKKAVTDAFSG